MRAHDRFHQLQGKQSLTDNTSRLPLRDGLSWWSLAGLVLGLGFFVLSALSAYSNVQNIRASETRIRNTHEVLTTLDDVMVGQEFIACLKDVLAEVTVRIKIARGRVYLARYLDTDFQVSAALFDQLNAVQQKRERRLRRRENNRRQGR